MHNIKTLKQIACQKSDLVGMTDLVQGKMNRKKAWLQPIWAAAAYLVLSVLVMGANPFKGETLAPMGMLSVYPGWASHSFASPYSHPERSDILDGYLPGWMITKLAICENGKGGGDLAPAIVNPSMLNVATGKWTPSYLAFLAIDEHWLALYFANLIKLIIAAIGGFLFLRLFTMPLPAFMGGAIFAFSGFNAAWFYWPQVSTSAWIPWVLWTCAGWYLFRRRRWLLGVVGTTVMLILGGFPAVAAYGLGAVVLLAAMLPGVLERNLREVLRTLGYTLAAIAIAFLVVAIPLLALSEIVGAVDLSYRQGGTSLVFPGDLKLLLDPFADGLPTVDRTFYAGAVAFVLALAAPLLIRGKEAAALQKVLAWYGLVLLAGSVMAAFGLFPQDLLRAIPVVGTSAWNRFTVITGLSIAILAAVAFDRLMARFARIEQSRMRYLALACLAAAASYQFYSQAILFRTFNSVAVAEDFYPLTPAIGHMQSNLGPTQSVVADNGYMIPGTLRAYGIPEWFAHGFKTEAEKATLRRLVEEPFKSATAAYFSASAIRLDGDLYARLGIRYVLMTRNKYRLFRRQPPNESLAAPALQNSRLVQLIRLDEPVSLSAIAILLGTDGTERPTADVLLQVRDAAGRVLAESAVAGREIKANARKRTFFRFADDVELPAGTYGLHLSIPGNNSDTPIAAAYSSKVQHAGDVLMVGGEARPAALLYSLYEREKPLPVDPAWWRVVDLPEEKITVLENLRAPQGAYWIGGLSEKASWAEERVVTTRPDAGRINVHYSGANAGYIILPVRLYPGWIAYVNGAEQPVQPYLGMMPAIRVEGSAEIEYIYKPTYLSKGSVLMLGAVPLLMLLMHFAGRARAPQFKTTEQDH